MKKIACYFLFLLTVQSFAQIRISGTIKNAPSNEVTIDGLNGYAIEKTELTDGKFSFDIALDQGYYYLSIGDESSTIYLKKDHDLQVSVDYNEYDETIEFSGKGAEASNYLSRKSKINGSGDDLKAFFLEDPKAYKKNVLALDKKLKKELAKFKVSEDFKKDEIENMKYQYFYYIYKFAQFQDFYFEKTIAQPEEFVQEVANINYDDASLYARIPYYRYLAERKWHDLIAEKKSYNEMRNKFYEITTRELQGKVFVDCYYSISRDDEKAEDYYKMIKYNSTSKEFIKSAKEEYDKVKNLQKGKKSPLFNYEDIDGNKVALADLKGKYIYIDVWATWCKPCIAQIPDLKQLEHDYRNENIAFVSISVDKPKAKEKWKAMVKKKGLAGIQLFADNGFDSEFIDTFGISSIPSFILIDPEGKIVQRRTSKPSAQKIRTTFDALLKK